MKEQDRYFRYFGYNSYRLITSAAVFAFVIYCAAANPSLPFGFSKWIYALITAYYALFPIKDMISRANKTLYKGKQFAENYIPVKELDEDEFRSVKRKYDMGALRSAVFWLVFMAAAGALYLSGIIGRIWILFLFAMSDFCVYFAIFFWCPFHKILLKPHCCMDCRIFNWDSFFSFSFLIFLPSVFTCILITLSLISLVKWEITYYRHPKRFFIISNKKLSCENCDMEHCKNYKKHQNETNEKENIVK